MVVKSSALHINWGRPIQARVWSSFAKVRHEGTSTIRGKRNSLRDIWLSFWIVDHDNKHLKGWLLLVNHGGRLPRLCQEIYTMLKAWQSYSPKTGGTTFHTLLWPFAK